MIEYLPRWVWLAGGLLAFAAGLMNVVGLLSFGGEAVTHLTGTTTLLAGDVANARWADAAHLVGILGAFVVGAAFSGWLIRHQHLRLGRRYGLALWIEAALVALATLAFAHMQPSAYYLLAFAVGQQNAMATTYSGATLRTSHVTGMFTDLGIALGHALRGLPIDHRRLALSLMVIAGFSSGGLCGALGMRVVGPHVLWLVVLICGGLATANHLHRSRHAGSVRS